MNKKKTAIVLFAAILITGFSSCLKETKENETILVHDPQIIPFISDTTLWPQDLLTLFDEQYVNFGDTPPRLNFTIKLERQKYVATNLKPGESPAIGSITPVKHLHQFHDQYIQICLRNSHEVSFGPNNTFVNQIDSVFVTGHDNKFTVYFHETFANAGRPTHAVIMSGTLVDTTAIKDYRYGYKIVRYGDSIIPTGAYPLNSIFIFENPDSTATIIH